MKNLCIFFCILSLFIFPDECFSNPLKDKFQRATMSFFNGDVDAAIKDYNDILKVVPDFAQVHNYLGLCYKSKGESFDKVIGFFEKAIELDPNFADPYEHLAKIYYAIGSFDEAIGYASEVLELDVDHTVVQLILGWSYLIGKSDKDEAISYFEAVVERGNDLPYAMFGLGMAYYMNGENFRTLDAITKLKKAGSNEFASQLEDVVRKGKFDTNAGVPDFLFPPLQRKRRVMMKQIQEVKKAQQAHQKAMEQKKKGYNVRLRKQYLSEQQQPDDSYYDDSLDVGSSSRGDRIKALQQNSKDLNLDF